MKRYLGLLIMYCLLLVLVAPVTAQEAPTPEAVGLRPDAPAYALHGPYWVGTITFEAETPSHPTQVALWYPALNPSETPEDITYSWDYFPDMPLQVAGHAIADAAPDTQGGPYPLVIVAHGLEASRYFAPYLSEHLASEGFVVMSIDFADNVGTVGTVPLYSMLYTRPQDVSWQIDQAIALTAAGGKLEGMIDAERIAVVGHSLGGYTALASAGAQLDFSGLAQRINEPVLCIEPPELGNLNACTELLDQQEDLVKLAGLDAVPEALWPSWGDPRVDAIVALAPKAMPFGTDGVTGVTIPAMLMGGSLDPTVSTPLEVDTAYEQLGSENKALVTLDGAGHMIYFWDCSVGQWMVDFGAFWVCADPVWDMLRAHDLVNHFTTAFLLDVLEGDTDAHAALAPDAVSFPGVEYQAQGF